MPERENFWKEISVLITPENIQSEVACNILLVCPGAVDVDWRGDL